MNLAIVLTHNKPDNSKQIEDLASLIEDNRTPEVDKEGNPTGRMDKNGEIITRHTHYNLKGLPEHEVKFYQIVPFGVERPANMNLIDSHNVIYGKGDEDKVRNHKRFFNWGLKRATDYGADLVLHLDGNLNVNALKGLLTVSEKRISIPFGVLSRKDDVQKVE